MGADEEWTLCDKKEVLELDISYPIEKIHAQTFGIKISTGKNRQFEIVFCKEKQCCFVDRTTAGVNPHSCVLIFVMILDFICAANTSSLLIKLPP